MSHNQATLMLHPSKIKSFSNFFAKVTQNLSRSVNKHSKYHYPSAKCDSYKVKSSSNQSKETFGNANTLLFHKFLSCIVIRQQFANLDSSFQGLDQCPKLTPLEHQQVLTHPEKIRVTNPPITSVYNNLLTSIIATVVLFKGPTCTCKIIPWSIWIKSFITTEAHCLNNSQLTSPMLQRQVQHPRAPHKYTSSSPDHQGKITSQTTLSKKDVHFCPCSPDGTVAVSKRTRPSSSSIMRWN